MPHKDPETRRNYQREYQRKWMANPENRAQQRSSVRRRQAEVAAQVEELKKAPCTDCGNRYDPVCMDWDHLPQHEKRGNVSEMLTTHSAPAVFAEIAKCELVCSNCHRLRTKNRLRTIG